MKERQETNPSINDTDSQNTPYALLNLAAKTATISFSVSLLTQPFQPLLNWVQRPAGVAPLPVTTGGLFRGVYRGFIPHAIAGQKRGAVAVTAKQANKEAALVEEELETELRSKSRSWMAATAAFSQADIVISNGISNLGRLKSAGIIGNSGYSWSARNFYSLTKVNWGSRSVAGFVNFAAIGFVGDKISGLYGFSDELYNKIAGGATAGVFATAFTTLPNSYADRKLLGSTLDGNGRVLTRSMHTMFSDMRAHTQQIGMKQAFSKLVRENFFREFCVRSPQVALTFAIIFGVDHALGSEPLRSIWPQPNTDDTRSSVTPGKTM
jgi:hypothetical protein